MNTRIRTSILVLIDIFLASMSFILALYLRYDGIMLSVIRQNKSAILTIVITSLITKLFFNFVFKLYSSLWKYAGIYELVTVTGSAFVSNILMTVYTAFAFPDLSASIFVIMFFSDVSLLGGSRISYRVLRRLASYGFIRHAGTKRVLIVGGGEAGAVIIKELKNNADLKSVPVAIIDDDRSKIGKKLSGIPVVGGRNDIVRSVENRKIDEIIIAIPSAHKRDINEIFEKCRKTQCKVKILPSVSQLINETVSIKKIRDVDIEDLLGREPIKLDIGEMSSYLTGKVILVTGGGGSIGSELCRQIAAFKPKQLVLLDNYENAAYDIQNELKYNFPELNLSVIIANIREKPRMETVFRIYKPEVVFHAAAHKHVPLMEDNPTEAIKNNVFGTLNLVECSDKYNVCRFVLISTDKAVNPTNIMGATKRIAEMIIQATNRHSKTEFVAVRFGNVLGSNGSVIPLFKKQIEQGGPVTVTHPDITRFFMTISEAVQLVIQAGAMARGGEIFVLDMGQPVKIVDLARNLIRLSGFEPGDIKIEFTGLRPGEKLYEELMLAEEGMRSTKNEKIYIAPPVFTDLMALRLEIDKLNEIIASSGDRVVEFIPKLVPAYRKAQ